MPTTCDERLMQHVRSGVVAIPPQHSLALDIREPPTCEPQNLRLQRVFEDVDLVAEVLMRVGPSRYTASMVCRSFRSVATAPEYIHQWLMVSYPMLRVLATPLEAPNAFFFNGHPMNTRDQMMWELARFCVHDFQLELYGGFLRECVFDPAAIDGTVRKRYEGDLDFKVEVNQIEAIKKKIKAWAGTKAVFQADPTGQGGMSVATTWWTLSEAEWCHWAEKIGHRLPAAWDAMEPREREKICGSKIVLTGWSPDGGRPCFKIEVVLVPRILETP